MSSAQQKPATTSDEQLQQIRINDMSLTKAEQQALLREFLPACQPQEGSPPNTFTTSEIEDLQKALPNSLHIGPREVKKAAVSLAAENNKTKQIDISDLDQWQAPPPQDGACCVGYADVAPACAAPPQGGDDAPSCDHENFAQQQSTAASPTSHHQRQESTNLDLDWHGAPKFAKNAYLAREFRAKVRAGKFTSPTNGVCPGFLQCNLVVLPQGQEAFDFLLFCQRNPKACPLIDVCDVGSPHPHGVAKGADLRTDVPKYAIYRNGKLEKEVTDATEYWPENSVAFLIGCSFSYDGPLQDAGIPLKSAEQGKNVPMYKTSLRCRPAGDLRGNMVVSMKPIPALMISKHVEITSKYAHAHGGPVCVGSASAIGIQDIDKPEWGDAIDIAPDEVPVFHACGVTPQSILMESKVPFAITHAAGHMFVCDLPSDLGV